MIAGEVGQPFSKPGDASCWRHGFRSPQTFARD
jgi:hypothetical protein